MKGLLWIGLCLWGLAFGLVAEGSIQQVSPPYVLWVDSDDNDDDDEKKPSPEPPADKPRLTEPRTSSLSHQIQRELRVGAIWVVVQNNRQRFLRVGLEYQGRLVSAVSLDGQSGEPIPYEFGDTFFLLRPLTPAQLAAHLRSFRAQAGRRRLGESGVVQGGVVKVPVWWGGRLVNYVFYDPRSQQVLTHARYAQELRQSPLKLR